MSDDLLMPIHDPQLLARGERVLGPEFRAMSGRVLQVTALTSRLNVLPFDDEAAKAALFAQILGRPLPPRVTIYPPFYTDHGLRLDFAERVFVNQGCTFLDYAGIRLGEGVMVGPKATFITVGHPVDPGERRHFLTGAPIDVAENVWIGAGATILPGVHIGRDAVVAAGAVVADDVPARSLVTGPKGTVRRRW
ncbi:acetyltransferase-like isoleucine patch superfamily enzyme [Stackebrandtia albiflava]|uniref:Acetyltransferase-like isoleucine patch superfamily enzyme n=1 Tax=Stackebrandtia albiflava TaxID=406432 RepID=A0A562VDG6_9ACTN|nr:DapH/DapD/GlmU-related protein [Stackebrandtia albiflava]TWJ15924.1 acetyltransferase-like isoleucine patch superfamily enzyme [Stackebrandtia albiflava]